MTEKKIIVDYYFDYCCPWTYLSFKRLIQTTTRTASVINWKPILIADIEKEISQKNESRTLHPSEIKYKKKDLQDWANYCGLKIIARTNVPKETSTKALCGAFFAVEANKIAEYSALVFDAYFADLKDIANNDILIEIATKIELDLNGFQSAIDSVQNIDQLKENTSELLEKGGFGSPTMFVGDDMYFGNDRMPLVEISIGGASGKILVLPGQHGTKGNEYGRLLGMSRSAKTTRRNFLLGGASAIGLSLNYSQSTVANLNASKPYRSWEDLARKKWTWDSITHSTHGTNCTGKCAFNVYVKDGVAWR